MPTFSHLSVNWYVAIPVALIALTVLVVGISLLVWLWRDANRYGQPGWVWVLLTLIFGFPILIWLIVRSTTLVKPPGAAANG